MANDPFPPTLDPLIAAIEAAIRARFPGFASVEFHRDASAEGMPLPACLLAMTRCDRSRDNNDGSGLLQATLRFEARIALPATDASTALQLRNAALALATWLHQLGRVDAQVDGGNQVGHG